ncbi:acyl-CoA thioesterase [Actibacterium sp.]|uniref:acyl-CoA thioesterase n=1 Tax=Actibacterium sp. TaxID=1872125 RepID=UPI0035653F43
MSIFVNQVQVSFGDCDPAGIVFYPNYFRWMDATFHAFLHDRVGGHAKLCRDLGARGLGLMEAKLSFRLPATEGRALEFAIEAIEWSGRSFTVNYRAVQGARVILEGYERRGVFVEKDGRLAAGDVAPVQEILG